MVFVEGSGALVHAEQVAAFEARIEHQLPSFRRLGLLKRFKGIVILLLVTCEMSERDVVT